MKNNSWKTWFYLTLATILIGLIAWYVFSQAQFPLLTFVAILILIVGVSVLVWRIIRNIRNRALGVPPEDEFTRLAKVYAGNRAFETSLLLWLLIFIFNSSFQKTETLLEVGILGSAITYFICLWYYKKTGGFNVDKD